MLLLLSLFGAFTTAGGVESPKVPGIDLIGQGYNILLANPDIAKLIGQYQEGMVDPGLTGKRIFTLTYENNRKNADGSYTVPDQADFTPNKECDDGKNFIIYGAREYQDDLMSKFYSGGFEGGFHTQAFALSMGIDTSYQSMYDHYETTCIDGGARYNFTVPDVHILSPPFVQDVCSLQTGATQSDYRSLVETYGTHVIRAADLGFRSIQRRRIDIRKFLHDVYVGRKMHFDKQGALIIGKIIQRDIIPQLDDIFGSPVSTWSVGSDDEPHGMKLQLLRLTSALDSHSVHWDRECKNAGIASCCDALPNIRAAVDNFLRLYAHDNANQSPIESETRMKWPVAWPTGDYALYETNSGCPKNKDFVWKTGHRLQRNTASSWLRPRGDNEESSDNHFPQLSVKDESVKQKFCVKKLDDEETDPIQAMPWQRGHYCIFQIGNNCPEGFQQGSIWFDDALGSSESHGDIPVGEYTTKTTKPTYCCRNDGQQDSGPLVLPTARDFFLFPQGSPTCPKVYNMQDSLERIDFSRPYYYFYDSREEVLKGLTPNVTVDASYIKLPFCFYTRSTTDSLFLEINLL